MAIHHLNVDLETYSSVPIKKAGLYKYVQSPDFEILLLGYSLDGAAPVVIDRARGEKIPGDLLRMLNDPNVIKHAFNAAFEWFCLAFGRDALLCGDPFAALHQWRDTMLHAAYCGYPGSLDAVGKAMGLPEDKRKLATGKALIRLFCTPHTPTARDARTRVRPADEPEKWDLFKTYNAQDVVAEQDIERRLSAYPVPDWLQRQWETDQRINARGVGVDMDLVSGALDCSTSVTKALTTEAQNLTGLDNPNSVPQLSSWLSDQLEHPVDDLRKESVSDLLTGDLPGPVRRVLEIRQELSKASVKKYDAMRTAACADSRIRGSLRFYGANRTGRWCLTGDHEVLTPTGWTRFDRWDGGEIACWSPATEFISFQSAKALKFSYSGEMIHLQGQRIDQISTPDHKMAVLQKNGEWAPQMVKEASKRRFTIPFTGFRTGLKSLEPDKLRVLIMTQADGHYTQDGNLRFHFKKDRKIERCKHLLRHCEIPFLVQKSGKATTIIIKSRYLPLWLREFKSKIFGPWLLDENPDTIFEELPLWDGYQCGPNSIQYTSIIRQNVDLLQAAATLSGRSATQITKHNNLDTWNPTYILNIWNSPGRGTSIRTEQVSKEPFEGSVYCAETKTGYFVVRRSGKVWITGNSGRIIQPQNLPRTHLPAIDLARELVKARKIDQIEMIYGSVHDVLSNLVRTALVPHPGNLFVDADFSAIEARVIAWLAGQEDTLEVFRHGGDIYCATASRMFGVPVVKGGVNGELRQRGKVATLALGYQGSVGALDRMDIQHVLQDDEKPEIVQKWRETNRAIVRLWYALESAAISVIQTARPAAVRGLVLSLEGDAETKQYFLTIRLPSGRKLYYPRPYLETGDWGRPAIRYWGVAQMTHNWGRQETYGGKLVENCVQAIARDCLAEKIEALEAADYPVVFHVHDEVIIDAAPERAVLDDVVKIMSEPISWAPDLPLNADGWIGKFYTKE